MSYDSWKLASPPEEERPKCECTRFRECANCGRLYCEHGYAEELLPPVVKVEPFHVCPECE
jgi:hypothetical protein